MFVQGYFVPGMHVFRSENKMLGAIVLRADLEHECPGRRIAPDSGLAFVFFQQERFGCGFGRRGGSGLSWGLGNANGYERRAGYGKGCAE